MLAERLGDSLGGRLGEGSAFEAESERSVLPDEDVVGEPGRGAGEDVDVWCAGDPILRRRGRI